MSHMPSLDAQANWIPDHNRFSLPKPPTWFLKTLWDFDAALVLIPSRKQRKYILARRREFSKGVATILNSTQDKAHARAVGSDSDMLADLKCVMVDSITGNVYSGSWMRSCPAILAELRSRDMWAAGGAEAYHSRLVAAEQAEAAKKRETFEANLDHRASDAWRSYQARTGQRTRVTNDPGISRTTRAKIVQVGRLY